jgi:hypothetical protein
MFITKYIKNYFITLSLIFNQLLIELRLPVIIGWCNFRFSPKNLKFK